TTPVMEPTCTSTVPVHPATESNSLPTTGTLTEQKQSSALSLAPGHLELTSIPWEFDISPFDAEILDSWRQPSTATASEPNPETTQSNGNSIALLPTKLSMPGKP